MSSELVSFRLVEERDPLTFGGGVHIGDGVLYDLGVALADSEDGRTIRTGDERIIAALQAHHLFEQVDAQGQPVQESAATGEPPEGDGTPPAEGGDQPPAGQAPPPDQPPPDNANAADTTDKPRSGAKGA